MFFFVYQHSNCFYCLTSKMIERLKNMKRNARGNGEQTCVLCNEPFGMFGLKAHPCHGCSKVKFETDFMKYP